MIKLQQNQVYKKGDEYIRIVQLERLEVQYKAITNLLAGDGEHHHVSKKEFCRLIKHATLLSAAEIQQARIQTNPEDSPSPPQVTSI